MPLERDKRTGRLVHVTPGDPVQQRALHTGKLDAIQVVNQARVVEQITSANGWTNIGGASASVTWRWQRALILLSVGQFANPGGRVEYRIIRTDTGAVIGGGSTKWFFFLNEVDEHHASAFFDIFVLPAATYTVQVQWQVPAAGTAKANADDNVALMLVPLGF